MPDQVERLRAILGEIVATKFGGNRTAAARAIGVKQPTIQEALGSERKAPTRGVGPKTAQGMARVAPEFSSEIQALLGASVAPVANPSPPQAAEGPVRYATERKVVDALVARGHDVEAVRRAAGSVAFKEGSEQLGELDLYLEIERVLQTDGTAKQVKAEVEAALVARHGFSLTTASALVGRTLSLGVDPTDKQTLLRVSEGLLNRSDDIAIDPKEVAGRR